MSAYAQRRKRTICYKSTKAYKRNDLVIAERLQIKTSSKPTYNNISGDNACVPKLAPLSILGEVNNNNNNNNNSTFNVFRMQQAIQRDCGLPFGILHYKEKEEDKENIPQNFVTRPARLSNINNQKLDSTCIMKFRVAKSAGPSMTDAEYDFNVDTSSILNSYDPDVNAIEFACEEAIYRLDALHVVNTLNDIVAYENPSRIPFIRFVARLYYSSPVDKTIANVQSKVKMAAFTVRHPRNKVTLDDVLNIPGYKDIDYPHYCCPESLANLYMERAIKDYKPEITYIPPSPQTRLRMLKNSKYKYRIN